jgi:exopolyphosphatase/guanosine-5'-triphosphate,3'-diphosphate pyrophosphatase
VTKPSRVALIEIGSNSSKLLIADTARGDFRVRLQARRTTRVGRGLDERGGIAPRALARTVAAVASYRKTISRAHCDRVFVFSTFALRKASNARAARRAIERSAGAPVHVLSGQEEARYAYLSAKRSLPLESPVTVLVDVGGGSTELVASRNGRVVFARSLPLGALLLSDRFIHTDPVDPGEFAALERQVDRVCRRALRSARVDRVPPGRIDLAVSGGAVGALSWVIARSASGARERAEGRLPEIIRVGQAAAFLDRCLSLPLRERRRIRGLDPDRADIICAGLAVVLSMARGTRKRVIRPNLGGLREGVLLHLIQNGFRWRT